MAWNGSGRSTGRIGTCRAAAAEETLAASHPLGVRRPRLHARGALRARPPRADGRARRAAAVVDSSEWVHWPAPRLARPRPGAGRWSSSRAAPSYSVSSWHRRPRIHRHGPWRGFCSSALRPTSRPPGGCHGSLPIRPAGAPSSGPLCDSRRFVAVALGGGLAALLSPSAMAWVLLVFFAWQFHHFQSKTSGSLRSARPPAGPPGSPSRTARCHRGGPLWRSGPRWHARNCSNSIRRSQAKTSSSWRHPCTWRRHGGTRPAGPSASKRATTRLLRPVPDRARVPAPDLPVRIPPTPPSPG